MNLVETSLKSIIDSYGPERTEAVLSGFVCDNEEVQDFIKKRAINHENRRLARTMLVFDRNADMKLVGFYSITIKSLILKEKLSTSKKVIYFGTAQTNGNVIPAILIGQLGKNDAVKSKFTGSDLMNLIFEYIYEIDKLVPSVVAYVEHDGRESLVDYYEKNDFMYFKRESEENEKELYCHIISTQKIVDMVNMSN
ncbi:MAG: hypothetical protein J6O00_03610 [Clostridiales bacterium]|nr:hypothetical protein [Clostridiales bacterium]